MEILDFCNKWVKKQKKSYFLAPKNQNLEMQNQIIVGVILIRQRNNVNTMVQIYTHIRSVLIVILK